MNEPPTNCFSSNSDKGEISFGLLVPPQGNVLAGWGGWEESSSPAMSRSSVYAPDFFLKDTKPWKIPSQYSEFSREQFAELFEKPEINKWNWSEPEEQIFCDGYNSLFEHLKTGELQKGVPYTLIRSAKMPNHQEILAILRRLLDQTHLWIYAYATPGEGIIGASPELFCNYNRSQRTLHAMALAGTISLQDYQPGCLLSDHKLRREHDIVIESILKNVEKFGDTTLHQTDEVKAHRLVHLRTDIYVQCDQDISLKDVVGQLHPTPALGVHPNNLLGQKWLRDCDLQGARRRFGAPFGWQHADGSFQLIVAIRNLQWHAGTSHIYAGCGVIPTSRLSVEWMEAQNKLNSIRDMLGI